MLTLPIKKKWFDMMREIIDAQPEQNLGKWVDDGDPLSWVCSECGYLVARYNNTLYCPNCGAKMINPKGEQDGYNR